MAIYIVTASNWNSAAFWSGITETGTGHTLDFSALDATYSVSVNQTTGVVTIVNGFDGYTVGEAGVTGVNANFGGTTLLDYFTTISGAQSGDQVTGSAEDELLDGNSGDDRMEGMAGNDTFYGNGGADQMDGGDGADILYGGSGGDELYGGTGADQIFGESDNDTIDAESGDDFVNGGAGADLIFGGDGADQLEGGYEDDSADTIYAGTGNDLVFGGGGDDSIFGEAGLDYLDGQAGNDYIDGGLENDRILGDLGSDTIFGGGSYDTLTGGEGADLINGGSDGDHIYGNAGDTIDGGETGDDFDTLYVSYVDFITYSTAESGTVTFNSGDTLTFTGIEQVVTLSNDGIVQGTAGGDQIGQFYFDADGDWVDNGDAIGEGDGDSIRAGDGNDTVWSNDGDDTVHGEGGNDRINLGGGNNVAFGGAGADTINGEWQNDTISGDDFIASGPNLIVNGSFEDTTGMTTTGWGFSGAGAAPGWTDANGFAVEFHNDGRGGLTATDGSNWLDLEANPGQQNTVSQTVAGVQDGQVYVLSFDAADLSNINDGTTQDNQLQVIWNGDVVGTIDASDGSWRNYEFYLIGGSGNGSNTLVFQGLGDVSGVGASIDNVQLYEGLEAAGDADSIVGGDGNDDLMGGAGDDTIDAGNGADEVVGGSGNDYILAGAGNDKVYGGTGQDTILDGAGDDLVYGGDGNDVVYGGDGADTFSGNFGADEILGGDGADNLQGGQGNDTLQGGNDNDTILGDGQWFTVADYASGGGAATNLTIINSADGPIELWWIDGTGTTQQYATIQPGDTFVQPTFEDHNWVLRDSDGYWLELIEGAPNQTVNYGAEGLNDSLDGGVGNDTLIGQFGNDTLLGGDGDDSLVGGSGDDVLRAQNNTGVGDTLLGGTGNDILYDSFGTATLDGGDGSDLIHAGTGTATVIGGDEGGDNDTLSFADANDTVSITLNGNEAGFYNDDDGDSGTFTGIESFELTSGNDFLDGTVVSSSITVSATAGNDTIIGGSGDDLIDGGQGNDSLISGLGSDTLLGGDGNDLLIRGGTDANDVLNVLAGGTGDDTIRLQDEINVNDQIDGGDGIDTLEILPADNRPLTVNMITGDVTDLTIGTQEFIGIENVTTGGGNDTIIGNGVDNVLDGGADADTFVINDSFGQDTIAGGETITTGTDFDRINLSALTTSVTVNYSSGEAGTIDDNANTDTITFSEIERLVLTDQADVVNGGGGNEVIDAGGGDDTVSTGTGNDSILGGAGNDSLIGGDGNDTVDGGAGDDYVAAFTGDDSLSGGDGNDDIFSLGGGNDTLDGGADADLISVMTMSNTTVTGGETVTTGTDDDTLNAGAGVDMTLNVSGAESGTITNGAETITYSGIEAIRLGSGNDTVEAGTESAALNIDAGGGDDLFNAASTSGDNTFEGQSGNDTIFGGSGNETLGGGSGNDQIFGGAGNDSIRSGGDADTVEGGLGNDTIDGAQGDDLLDGGDGADLILGGDGADTIRGATGNDDMIGGGDADTFILADGFGVDTIGGGETATTGTDFDTVDLSGLTTGATVDLSGAESGSVTNGANSASFTEIENVSLGGGRDTVVLADGSGSDTVTGFDLTDSGDGSTNDQLDVSGLTSDGGTTPIHAGDVTVTDTNGDGTGDAILSFPGGESITLVGVLASQVDSVDELVALGIPDGRDFIVQGTAGDDLIDGSYSGDPQGDLIDATDHSDASNFDSVQAGAGDDTVMAGAAGDSVDGGDGNDVLYGGGFSYTPSAPFSADFNNLPTDPGIGSSGGSFGTGASGGAAGFQFTGDSYIIADPDQGGADVGDVDSINVTFGFDVGTAETGANGGISFSFGRPTSISADPGLGLNEGVTVHLSTDSNEVVFSWNGTEIGREPYGGNVIALSPSSGSLSVDATGLVTFDSSITAAGPFTAQIPGTQWADTDTSDFTFVAGMNAGALNPNNWVNNIEFTGTTHILTEQTTTGNDTLLGGLGNDSLFGQDGNDSLVAGDGNDFVDGGSGDDFIDAGTGSDTVDAGDGNDQVFAWTGDDSVLGGAGSDTVFGQDGNDTIFGGIGNDYLDGDDALAGADSIFGEDGDDTIIGDGGNDTLSGGSGNDQIFAGADDDIVEGGTGNDQLYGEGGNDSLDAGAGNDTVLGGDGNDTIIGFEGNDSVLGGAGDDVINTRTSPGTGLPDEGYGASGNPLYYPADSDAFNDRDTVDGGIGNDSILTGDDNDVILGGDGADTVDAGFDDDEVYGDAGADSLEGNEGNDTISGGADGDVIYGDVSPTNPDYPFYTPYELANDGTDLAPNNNADLLSGNGGNDTIYGQDDNDTISGGLGDDEIYGGIDNDSLIGDDGSDTIDGGSGIDYIDGGTGADLLYGGTGDLIGPNLIADGSFEGATPTSWGQVSNLPDWYSWNTASPDLSDDTGYEPTYSPNAAPTDGTNYVSMVNNGSGFQEGISQDLATPLVAGTTYTITLDAAAGGYNNTSPLGDNLQILLFGNETAGQVAGDSGLPPGVQLLGSADVTTDYNTGTMGTITISFTPTTDIATLSLSLEDPDFSGGFAVLTIDNVSLQENTALPGDNDTIIGGTGDDTIFGQDGDDSLSGGADNDIVEGGIGNDWLSGNSGNDTVRGGDGADSVFGAEGDDVMYGDAGNDSMEGWIGNDTMFGGTGDDYIDGAIGADSLEGGDGNDTLLGGSDVGNDTLRGGLGDDSLSAGGGDDVLDGGDGADILFAADGNDQLDGGAGNDTLDGWTGNDTITAGTGDDQITGGDGDDTFIYVAGDGVDTITDFNFGNSGTLNDGDITNNDRIDLSNFYDDIWELTADFNDDGILNQSNDGVGDVDYSNNASLGGGGLVFAGATGNTSSFTVENTGVVCFASGTRILTTEGERLIETLRIGDRIITRDNGVQTLRWIGKRDLSKTDLARNPKLHPIHLSPKLTGGDLPLIVSPQHGVVFNVDGEETLVRAIHLARLQGGAARVMHGCRKVSYFHIMFEDHQIVFANGAPSESFFPGHFALAALESDVRSEIYELFPDLQHHAAEQSYGMQARSFARFSHLPDHLNALRGRSRHRSVPAAAITAHAHRSNAVTQRQAAS